MLGKKEIAIENKGPSDPRDKLLDNLENDEGPMIKQRTNFEH